ncbi:putative nuclease HARBI1 [Prorops nasuta]|uniref:putative nuclease HARBI1 n=1 Tax=Prorops nasuta TaxID=863751 RepID=UPI0034CFE799
MSIMFKSKSFKFLILTFLIMDNLLELIIIWNEIANQQNNNIILPINRERHIRINNYFENIVLYYSLTDFKTHFRVTRETFEELLQNIGPLLLQRRHQIQVEKQIAITLWLLGNQEVYRMSYKYLNLKHQQCGRWFKQEALDFSHFLYFLQRKLIQCMLYEINYHEGLMCSIIIILYFRSVADRFGMSKDTVWNIVFNVCFALESLMGNYIKWPTRHKALQIVEGFAAMNNFPGVVGIIDGTHIPISAPAEYSNSYINRKGFHSIQLQGICDHEMRFIDVFTGMCGSVHDARVWRLSDIKEQINQDVQKYFPFNTHLLGDSAYPCERYLLKPFSDNGHLTDIQKNFNKKLSSTRMTIEKAFGLLKARFRKLKYVYMYRTDMIPLVILSCCILHNICIDKDDEPFIPQETEDNDDYCSFDFDDGTEKMDVISHLIIS